MTVEKLVRILKGNEGGHGHSHGHSHAHAAEKKEEKKTKDTKKKVFVKYSLLNTRIFRRRNQTMKALEMRGKRRKKNMNTEGMRSEELRLDFCYLSEIRLFSKVTRRNFLKFRAIAFY